jgi:hypothetical protein
VEASKTANREDEGRARCAFVEGREESTFGEITAPGGGLVEGVVDRVPSYFFGEVGVDSVVRGTVQCSCEVYGEL